MAARAAATVAASSAVLLLAVLMLAGAGGAWAQSSTSGCTSTLVSLSPCLSYISGNTSAPAASCCSQLGSVVQSSPQCLCVALSADPASLGLTVNRTRALGLPDACKVKTPDVSNCKGAAGAPATSPGTATPTTPAAGGQTAPATGSKTTPSAVPEAAAAASPRGGVGVVAGFVVAALVVAGGLAV